MQRIRIDDRALHVRLRRSYIVNNVRLYVLNYEINRNRRKIENSQISMNIKIGERIERYMILNTSEEMSTRKRKEREGLRVWFGQTVK